MSKPTWVKIGLRSYKKSAGFADAFVFGAANPICAWAWSVYWSGGHSAWVENGFAEAKKKADECIVLVANGLEASNGRVIP